MFRHVGIVVKDLKRQLYFYKDLLNLEIYYHKVEEGFFLNSILNEKNIKIEIFKLGKNDKTIVELLSFKDKKIKKNKKTLQNRGITHFAITVSELDKMYLFLKKENIIFLSEPQINEEKTFKVCFCQDFEGNYIELVEKI